MGIVKQIEYQNHMIEMFDTPGYYLLDKVPVLSGNVKVENLSDTDLYQLFDATSAIWQPRISLVKRKDGYYMNVYMRVYDDKICDGHALVDGVLVHYKTANIDIQDPVAVHAVREIGNQIRHSGMAVWTQDGEMCNNLVYFSDWDLSIRQVFETAKGVTSWRA